MDRRRVLISWIGHADLRAFAATLEGPERDELFRAVKREPTESPGPIRTLLDRERFDHVHLLSNYEVRWHEAFATWLACPATVHPVRLADPTDYAAVFEAANNTLTKISGREATANTELCVHLSPGTPAMAAVWVLLGKTRYPATFYQTHKGRAWQTEIPFDIVVDFVPELLRAPDSFLQHLAAQNPGDVAGFEQVIGDSAAIRIAVGRARRAAMHHVPVLLLGESGTGKELFARGIHNASARRERPFVAINCAAIPRDLLESELFGYLKGAFTGAVRDKSGAFAQADGGTLFMDEIGECNSDMQAKLLRVLEPPIDADPCDRVYRPVGATDDRKANVRIVAATNRDLVGAVNAGAFREDLFYRLAIITVSLPALRDRRSDIPKIAASLLDRINREFRKHEALRPTVTLSAGAMQFAKRFDWPGNVRQLFNSLLQSAVMSASDTIGRDDLAAAVASVPGRESASVLEQPLGEGFSLEQHLESIQRHYLGRAMQEAGGAKTRAANLLGMKNYQTLDAQLKRLDVRWK